MGQKMTRSSESVEKDVYTTKLHSIFFTCLRLLELMVFKKINFLNFYRVAENLFKQGSRQAIYLSTD